MCIHRSDVHVAKTHAVEFRETFVNKRKDRKGEW
jgi:hypothetical protein